MKDDSLSDVDRKKIAAYHKSVIDGATVKGGVFSDSVDRALEVAKANGATVHPRVAEIKRAIELGDSVGKQENVYAKQIWNDAIEAAAISMDEAGFQVSAAIIRNLKK